MTRFFAVLLGVFFIGLAGLLASVTLFVSDPMPVLSNRSPVTFEQGELGQGGLRATVAVDPSYRFEVMGETGRGEATPSVSMRRGEGDGSPVDVDVQEAGAGLFQAHGQFTSPGRWTLSLDDGAGSREFTFILQE